MTHTLIENVHGGFKVDGLELLAGNCAFRRFNGSWGHCPHGCCFTFSRVKRDGNTILYLGKKTATTTNNYEWGYRVRKDGVEVEVRLLDSQTPGSHGFGGQAPPALSAWEERGWTVLFFFNRPIIGMGEPLPEWCTAAEPEITGPAGTSSREVDL